MFLEPTHMLFKVQGKCIDDALCEHMHSLLPNGERGDLCSNSLISLSLYSSALMSSRCVWPESAGISD